MYCGTLDTNITYRNIKKLCECLRPDRLRCVMARTRLGPRLNENWRAVDCTSHKVQFFIKEFLSTLISISKSSIYSQNKPPSYHNIA